MWSRVASVSTKICRNHVLRFVTYFTKPKVEHCHFCDLPRVSLQILVHNLTPVIYKRTLNAAHQRGIKSTVRGRMHPLAGKLSLVFRQCCKKPVSFLHDPRKNSLLPSEYQLHTSLRQKLDRTEKSSNNRSRRLPWPMVRIRLPLVSMIDLIGFRISY